MSAAESVTNGTGAQLPPHICLREDPLHLESVIQQVEDGSCGAVASFMGTTRNHSGGKEVTALDYEAYAPMAEKTIAEVCAEAQAKWPQVRRIAVEHKLGSCPIGQSGVNIAVSSAHRADAMDCCRYVIDEIKARAPIWKREIYADGSEWRENAEWRETIAAKKGCGCKH
ncbi:unnamed protein product [Vitrella brassicaformis CCMP3155]|uniref:MOCS2B n=1 Tax=Vitrella brassicaformis (strain CCMP3155) TaxID=1169540 RepID=A0A0G4G2D4_VITBC|nr:unnamed protein product [Vitrella brassicaformis CCMP3155]|eukprot:CEM22339.1 unnamed protein product [Vitrella brassicaformis CCMP3155]